MLLFRLLGALLLVVATNGRNNCISDDVCVSGSTSLDFEDCGIEQEEVDDLAACFDSVGRDNIESLNLDDNWLTSLPLDFLDGFVALQNLTLQSNDLTFEDGNFLGATSLYSLNLRYNDIGDMTAGMFEGLASLRNLDFHSSQVTDVESGTFANVPGLLTLDLTGNYGLGSLPEDIFSDVPSLIELSIGFCSFTTLPAGILSGLTSLRELDARGIDSATFPADVFVDLPSLQVLDLCYGDFTSFPEDAFGTLPSLIELNLEFTEITTLPAGIFSALPLLDTLDLESWKLSSLTAESFEGLKSLRSLDLAGNPLMTLPADVFIHLPSLRELDVGYCKLSTLPDGLFDNTPSLLSLSLGHNDIASLAADAFAGVPSLSELDLGGNGLTTLPADVFGGLTSLTTLDLWGNDLTTFDADVFDDLASIDAMYLNANDLTALPAGIFDALSSLTLLELDNNELLQLPADIFKGVPSLEYLELWGNRFSSLPEDTLDGLSALTELDLRYNEMPTLPVGFFRGTPALELLWLNFNGLNSLPAGLFDGLESLETLYLGDNDLSTLPAGLLDGLESLETLQLDDNPDLQCLPETDAESVILDDDFDDTTLCECPEDPVCDEDGVACECQPGVNGYSCVGSSSEVVRATFCPSSAECSSDDECADDEACCPTTQTCELLLGSSSSACGDPHMTGFRGQKFDFTGEDGAWYTLISDPPSLHLNMRVTTPVFDLPEITYITGISLMTVDTDGVDHSIVLSVTNPHSLDSSCAPGVYTCLADGALSVAVDGDIALATPGTASPGPGVEISAVNLPGACRSFGFEKYWERKMLEQMRVGEASKLAFDNTAGMIVDSTRSNASKRMNEWILGDPTATNMMECAAYVAGAAEADGGLFSYQSEHASFKISTPKATVRVSHGRLHQVAMRDPTDQYDLPDHRTWQMNLAVDHTEISRDATGVLGETFVPTVDAGGNAIMSGMEAIRGTQEYYRVAGPYGVAFTGNAHGF